MWASHNHHFDVLNGLLEYEQIDVNLQDKVSFFFVKDIV